MAKTNCGHCHHCGSKLRKLSSGAEWCTVCVEPRRYLSHGHPDGNGPKECPTDCGVRIGK